MEPEGKHRNSIMKQRILAVFGIVEIVLRCTLTMNDFQGLMMEPEGSDYGAGSLESPSSDPESQSWSKYISGQFQQAQIWCFVSDTRINDAAPRCLRIKMDKWICSTAVPSAMTCSSYVRQIFAFPETIGSAGRSRAVRPSGSAACA
ncbi:hypothetical protein EVAR_49318_1 [Eumeta japonica]|uniref:Uncharacterized protein n=1 Tax=Eumeta variegata TaxID=151549 RepID=A0A4C1YCP6_EUMVA|nr:hypothetical protein EVAR_49318_1 [Eumeta japonica]